MRVAALLVLAALLALAVWLLVRDEGEGDRVLERTGLVTHVVDGDTVHVRLGASRERVRLIGIDAPERGECYAARATALLRALAQLRVVGVVGDPSQRERDRFDRLLGYLELPGGGDAGRILLERGAAVVFETRPPFERRDGYAAAQDRAASRGAGLHGACRD